ncbi:MAG: OsmC family protein [Gemmatimonadaceae bacterium]
MSELKTIPGIEIRNINHARVTWRGGHRFDAGRTDGVPTIRIDADTKEGPGPVETLLCALASCSAVDVLDILEKRRTPVESLEVDVEAARAKATPARVIGILLRFRISGAGVERVHAERAIELAVTKYCTVRDTLDPSIPVHWTLDLQ